MEFVVIAVTLGLCFLVDKVFTKKFRSAPEHGTGKAVRLPKMYGSFGLILAIIGVFAIISGALNTLFLQLCGAFVVLLGVGLVVYYMTFGIYYGDDTFRLTTFGKRSDTYRYMDIRGQKLYLIQGGSVVVELHMNDGRTVSLQSNMEGVYPFLDHAYAAWVSQTGKREEELAFHDPSASQWFPAVDEEV